MSVYYTVYLQSNIHNQPISLGPFIKDKEGTTHFSSILEAYSWFTDAIEWIESKPFKRGLPDKLSKDLSNIFSYNEEDYKLYESKEKYYDTHLKTFKYRDIKYMVEKDKPYKYQGYITKEKYAQYQCGEDTEIEYWLTKNEYDGLEPEDKVFYVYFEWNQEFDAYGGLYKLINNIEVFLDIWKNNYNTGWNLEEIEEIIENVEVIIYTSY